MPTVTELNALRLVSSYKPYELMWLLFGVLRESLSCTARRRCVDRQRVSNVWTKQLNENQEKKMANKTEK